MNDTTLGATHPDPVVWYHHTDPDHSETTPTVTAVNAAFADQFGMSVSEPVDQPVSGFLDSIGIDATLEEITSVGGDSAEPGLTAEMEATAANGRTYALRRIETADADGSYLLLTDVSAAVETRAEIEARADRLEGFARTVTHDLRNPLEVAQSRLAAAESTGEAIHFEKTAAAHDRIRRLVEDVLSLARTGKTISATESVEVGEIVAEAWESIDADTAALAVEDGLGTVEADPERLRAVFENLFRNSLEHTDGDVTISVEPTAEGFLVADDGPGVPAEDREAVFEPGMTTGDGTTGLGLNIVDEIATAHGWEVSLTDSLEGGAQFEFSL